jgi:hypothetical protein
MHLPRPLHAVTDSSSWWSDAFGKPRFGRIVRFASAASALTRVDLKSSCSAISS